MDEIDPEIQAISTIISVLKPLDEKTRSNVLDYILKKYDFLDRFGPKIKEIPNPPSQLGSYLRADEASNNSIDTQQPLLRHGVDIRTFAAEKSPKSVNEKITLVAYFMAHLAPPNERRDFITAEDIKPLFTQAGFQLPAAMPNVTLNNAKSAGYLIAKERGQFQINAVGHNLVVHKLPYSSEKTQAQSVTRSKPVRKKSVAKPKSKPKK